MLHSSLLHSESRQQFLAPRLIEALLFLVGFLSMNTAESAAEEYNYDESRVPAYTLPDVLKAEDGTKIDTPELWTSKRRPELLRMFEEHVFGKLPQGEVKLRTKVRSENPKAIGGAALRREVTVYFSADVLRHHQDDEFVATQACHQVAATNGAAQALPRQQPTKTSAEPEVSAMMSLLAK